MDLKKAVAEIMKNGPDRVLVDHEGTAISSRRAREQGVVPDVIYIRNDGWSLAAPKYLEGTAFDLCRNEWIGVLRRPHFIAEPINQRAEGT